jgi:hypothetical protein
MGSRKRRVLGSNEPLSPDERHLLRLLSRVHYGRIEGLHVREGWPHFDPPPVTVRALKLGPHARNAAPIRTGAELKAQCLDLLHELRRLGDAVVLRIEVANGLPLFMEVKESGVRR